RAARCSRGDVRLHGRLDSPVVLRVLGFRRLLLFFLYGYRDHRDLHSFPTRRSSDLISASRAPEYAPSDESADAVKFTSFVTWKRSEEHTSELQSLRHLVCRLLLEKKKKHRIQAMNKEDAHIARLLDHLHELILYAVA